MLDGGKLRHDTPVGLVVARLEVVDRVMDVIMATICRDTRRVPGATVTQDIPQASVLQ